MDHLQFEILRDLTVIVVSATVAIKVFSFLKLPLLLGFILVGILLSPVFGIIKDTSGIAASGDLGVMFMMFFVGLEFNLERIRKVFVPSIFGLLFQAASMVLFGLFAADVMGMSSLNGFFLGALLSMSSTIVIIELFSRRRELNERYAQITVGILIAEDLFAVFLLVMLSSLASGRADIPALVETVVTMLTFVITVFVVGKLSVPAVVRRFFVTDNQQELVMFTFCVIMGVGFLANLADLSLALGAFLAGSIFSGTIVSERVRRLTDPFRNLFVALFFVYVGTMIDPFQIAASWKSILFISAAVLFVRTAACFFGIVAGGVRASDAFLSAMSKAQIGEFSFVVASLGIKLGVMDKSIMAVATGVSLLTVAVNPYVSAKSRAIMDFVSIRIPKSLKLGFEVYHKFTASLSEAAKKGFFASISAPLARVLVYTLLFNALMIVAEIVQEFLLSAYSGRGADNAISVAVWIAAAVFAVPAVWGISHNLKICARIIVSASPFGRSVAKSARSRAYRLFHSVFFTLLALFFSAVYFMFVWYHVPKTNTFVLFVLACAVFPFVIRKYFGNMGEELESEFTSVFKRHIENAGEHRRSVMMENIRRNYKWAIDISEVEISEFSKSAGKSVAELSIRRRTGADIAAVRRGRFVIYNIMPSSRIFPDDVVVLSGTRSETEAARKILSDEERDIDSIGAFAGQASIGVDCAVVSHASLLIGKTLAEADLTNTRGVKVLGILREGGNAHIRPSASEIFMPGDTVLIMGIDENLKKAERDFSLTLSEWRQ